MSKRQDKTNLTRLKVINNRKKTLVTLLTEYFLAKSYRVNQIDFPIKDHFLSNNLPINYQIADKKGVNKGSFSYLKEFDIILTIFNTDSIIIPWFNSLTKIQQKKVYFFPNCYSEIQAYQAENKKVRKKIDQRITFALNVNLIKQAEAFLQNKWVNNDYTNSSLSELIRASLQAYQQGKITLAKLLTDKNAPKRNFNMRIGEDLLNFYHSLPDGQRVSFIERSLLAYLSRF